MREVAASSRRSSEAGVARCRSGTGGDAGAVLPGAESFDLLSQVVLGIEPGAGDPGGGSDGAEGDRLAAGVQAAQRGHGPAPGVV